MKCMLFKTRKKLVYEFMKAEWEYISILCQYENRSEKETFKFYCRNETSFEELKFMSKSEIANRINFYNRKINMYEHLLMKKESE